MAAIQICGAAYASNVMFILLAGCGWSYEQQ
jgi:hypothetical protein